MKAFIMETLGIAAVVAIGIIIAKIFGWQFGLCAYFTGYIANDVSSAIRSYYGKKNNE